MTRAARVLVGVLILVTIALGSLVLIEYNQFGYRKTSLTQPGRLYQVVFSQLPTCGGLNEYAIPWAVKLGNWTIEEPANATLPPDGNRALVGIPGSGVPIDQTRITFSVPDGIYHYTLMPSGDFFDPTTSSGSNLTGIIHVDGEDVFLNVSVANPGGCGF